MLCHTDSPEDNKTPLSSIPPPSYDSGHSEVPRAVSNDVIHQRSNSSSSSDDFEDIIEAHVESQWELDRMVGFTLEECVQREWHRRQAAVGSGSPLTGSVSQPTKGTKASIAREVSHTPLKSPANGHTLDLRLSDNDLFKSAPSAQTQLSEDHSFFKLDLVTNSSKSSLDDWDVLEPRLPSLSSQKERVSTQSGAPQSVLQQSPLSDVESLSTVSSPSRECGRLEVVCVPFVGRAMDVCETVIPSRDYSYYHTAPPPHVKDKQRETCKTRDDLRYSAIHKRPLPNPPSSSGSTNANVSIDANSYALTGYILFDLDTGYATAKDIPLWRAVEQLYSCILSRSIFWRIVYTT